MKAFLQQIVDYKKEEILQKKKRVSFEELKKKTASMTFEKRDFKEAILSPRFETSLIAEIKISSPSAGALGLEEDLRNRAMHYEKAGANAISLVVEKKFFHGNLDFIKQAKKVSSLPILAKDFIVDEYQIYQAKLYQADALLLIAMLLEKKQLAKFIALCFELGIEPVVEINNADDLEKVKDLFFHCLAINARDLDTFEVSVEKACDLLNQIPQSFVKLGFSGILSAKEVKQYKDAGAKGVLVGTALMRTNNPGLVIQELKKT